MLEKRIKSGIAIVPSALELCDKNLKLAKVHSRNDFVEKAIQFYAGYLNAESNPKFFEEIFTGSAEKTVKKIGETLTRSQFRLAVEVAKLANLIAATNDISDSQLTNLAQKCIAECKELAGVWDVEDVVRFQNRR